MSSKSLLVFLFGAGLVVSCSAAKTPGYARIVSALDEGGDYLEVVNAVTFQSDIEYVLDLVQQGVVEAGVLSAEDLTEVRKIRSLVTTAGLLSLRGCGSSVRSAEDGSYVHRSFTLVEKGKNPLLDLFASSAREATVERYLPQMTAAALSFSADVKGTALFAAEVMAQFEIEQAGIVRALCESADGQPSLADGIAPGTLVALTLDAKRPWKIPDEELTLPMPGVLVAQAVRNGQPWSMLKMGVMASIRSKSSEITCSSEPRPGFPNVECLVFTVPVLKEMGMTPAYAFDRTGGAILFANTVELLDTALAAGVKGRGRLFDEAAFRAQAKAPDELSGFVFLSPQVVPVLADLVRQGLAKENAPVPPTAQKLFQEPPPVWYTGTFTRQPDGVMSEARASFGAFNTLRILSSSGPASAVGLLGSAAGALFPAISQAQKKAYTSAFAMRGRNLFVGLIQANTEREALGLPSVWPRTKVAADADAEDVSGRAFRNGCDYFNTLFDTTSSAGKDASPYVACDLTVLGSNLRAGQKIRAGGLDWCVAANVSDETDDCVPVLVSANFNPAYLLAMWDGRTDATKRLPIGPSSGAAKSLFGDQAIVIVRKGGAAQVIQARFLTYKTLYDGRSFVAPSLEYLTPTGVVVPKRSR